MRKGYLNCYQCTDARQLNSAVLKCIPVIQPIKRKMESIFILAVTFSFTVSERAGKLLPHLNKNGDLQCIYNLMKAFC